MRKNLKLRIYAAVAVICALFLCMFAGFNYLLISAGASEILQSQWKAGLGMLAVVVLIVIFGTLKFTDTLYKPVSRLQSVIRKIIDGDLEARCGVKSGDEFQEIGNAIDTILSEHVSELARIEDENETLNDSIVAMLETVSSLARRDLSIKARVREDITGPLADALNMMTGETSKVLNEVTVISGNVAETSNLVKAQSDNVLLLANKEQEEVDVTARELVSAANAMINIAKLAEDSNIAAEEAIRTTITAMSSVTDTVDSINVIRESINETEKRVKRLGERSQEVNAAVNLISNISERTHILALNASMHAASAGEAGRGFGIVADEVQRLAENTREATSQISVLVNNIQVETTNTVNTMNDLITQVVDGSKLAEKAGAQMQQTQITTAELVSMVKSISDSAAKQEKISRQLRERTDIIRESVRKTGAHLQEQTVYTDELVEQAMSLVASVGVFKLQ